MDLGRPLTVNILSIPVNEGEERFRRRLHRAGFLQTKVGDPAVNKPGLLRLKGPLHIEFDRLHLRGVDGGRRRHPFGEAEALRVRQFHPQRPFLARIQRDTDVALLEVLIRPGAVGDEHHQPHLAVLGKVFNVGGQHLVTGHIPDAALAGRGDPHPGGSTRVVDLKMDLPTVYGKSAGTFGGDVVRFEGQLLRADGDRRGSKETAPEIQ